MFPHNDRCEYSVIKILVTKKSVFLFDTQKIIE